MRLVLGVLVAGVAFMVGRGRSERRGPGHQGPGAPPQGHAEQHAAADDAHAGAAVEQPVILARPAALAHGISGDDEHQREERRYWRRSIVISKVATAVTAGGLVFAGLAFIAGYRAMIETRRQADTAQEALIAADRPWIKVLELSGPRIEVRDNAVFLRAGLKVKNIGRSPAQHAFIRTKLSPDGSVMDDARETEMLCRNAAARGIPPFETLIFPDDESSIAIHALADVRDIAKHWRDRIERDYQLSRSVFGEDELAERNRAERLSYPVRVGLTLIGCVTYVIPTGRSYGQTAFIYYFNRACDLGPGFIPGECSFEMEEPGTHEGDALVIREAIGGAFAR